MGEITLNDNISDLRQDRVDIGELITQIVVIDGKNLRAFVLIGKEVFCHERIG